MSRIKVKNGDQKILVIHSHESIHTLRQDIKTRFRIASDFQIFYIDSDNDKIFIDSQDDLDIFYEENAEHPMKLNLLYNKQKEQKGKSYLN